jgi:hypothetical protein
MIRPAVGTIREGCEVPCDRHRVRPGRVPVNHNFLLAAFAQNTHPTPALRACLELIVSIERAAKNADALRIRKTSGEAETSD